MDQRIGVLRGGGYRNLSTTPHTYIIQIAQNILQYIKISKANIKQHKPEIFIDGFCCTCGIVCVSEKIVLR